MTTPDQAPDETQAPVRVVPAGAGWDWVVCGWRLFTKSPGPWLIMGLIYFVINIVLALVPMIGPIAFTIIAPVLAGGFIFAADKLTRGETIDPGDMFQGFRDKERTGPLFILGLVMVAANILIFVVVLLLLGGGVLAGMFVEESGLAVNPLHVGIAGFFAMLIVLTIFAVVLMLVFYAAPRVMLTDTRPSAAMQSSIRACLRNWLPLLVMGLICLLPFIIAMIPFMLGLIVVIPVGFCILYCSYRDIYG